MLSARAAATDWRTRLAASGRHASPIHSNYPINWLLMYSDLRSFGYNPYAPEFAALIREGKASRSYWRIMAPLVDAMILHRIGPGREVTRSLGWLGLTPADLRITKPRGAYDPVVGAPAAGNTMAPRGDSRLPAQGVSL